MSRWGQTGPNGRCGLRGEPRFLAGAIERRRWLPVADSAGRYFLTSSSRLRLLMRETNLYLHGVVDFLVVVGKV